MLDLTNILGTVNNIVHTYTNADGLETYIIEYDIEYLVNAAVLLLSLWFFFRLMLSLVRIFGGVRN